MIKYPKIQTVYKRDPSTNYKTLLEGQYSLPEFQYLADMEWEWTEKIDGTNIRIWNNPGFDYRTYPYQPKINFGGFDYRTYPYQPKINFGGRTDRAQIPPFLLSRLQEIFAPDKWYTVFEENVKAKQIILYGEGYGDRIQKVGSKYISGGVDFILFDVMIDGIWLTRDSVDDIAHQFGIKSVPIGGYGSLKDAVEFVKSWGKHPPTSIIAEDPALIPEGLVMRPRLYLQNRLGNRIITKIKYRDFR